MKKITKKGFTLAEVLIVLMVIGALATMLLPSLLKGVNDSQWKTGYKKAYNAISNLTAMERVSGALPAGVNDTAMEQMFNSMVKNLSVKDYVAYKNAQAAGQIPLAEHYIPCVKYKDPATGKSTSCPGDSAIDYSTTADPSPWIVTDDGIAYAVHKGTGSDCVEKIYIDAVKSPLTALQKSCVYLEVDVNGLSKGPNKAEPQMGVDLSGDSAGMKVLTGDRFYIFIGTDGATAGNKQGTISGRIVADIK